MLFFSDAVFAIAITLLAVDLRVPPSLGRTGMSVGRVIGDAAPSLFGFGISFAVIALFWLGHHGVFRYITAMDRPLIGLNLVFLGTIAFLPYPTEVLSASNDQAAAVVFYAACAAAAGIAEGAVWLYATRSQARLAHLSAQDVRRHILLRIARIPVVFLASIPVAIVAPRIAPYLWILIGVAGLVINRFAR